MLNNSLENLMNSVLLILTRHSRDELVEKLHVLGFSYPVCGTLIPKLPYETFGKSRLYTMPKDPMYKGLISSFYKKKPANKVTTSEEEALAVLANKGYQIRKCVGFDLDRFAKENPVLYKKYLKYEIV